MRFIKMMVRVIRLNLYDRSCDKKIGFSVGKSIEKRRGKKVVVSGKCTPLPALVWTT